MRGALLWALSDPYLDLPGARRVGPGISVMRLPAQGYKGQRRGCAQRRLPDWTRASALTRPCCRG